MEAPCPAGGGAGCAISRCSGKVEARLTISHGRGGDDAAAMAAAAGGPLAEQVDEETYHGEEDTPAPAAGLDGEGEVSRCLLPPCGFKSSAPVHRYGLYSVACAQMGSGKAACCLRVVRGPAPSAAAGSASGGVWQNRGSLNRAVKLHALALAASGDQIAQEELRSSCAREGNQMGHTILKGTSIFQIGRGDGSGLLPLKKNNDVESSEIQIDGFLAKDMFYQSYNASRAGVYSEKDCRPPLLNTGGRSGSNDRHVDLEAEQLVEKKQCSCCGIKICLRHTSKSTKHWRPKSMMTLKDLGFSVKEGNLMTDAVLKERRKIEIGGGDRSGLLPLKQNNNVESYETNIQDFVAKDMFYQSYNASRAGVCPEKCEDYGRSARDCRQLVLNTGGRIGSDDGLVESEVAKTVEQKQCPCCGVKICPGYTSNSTKHWKSAKPNSRRSTGRLIWLLILVLLLESSEAALPEDSCPVDGMESIVTLTCTAHQYQSKRPFPTTERWPNEQDSVLLKSLWQEKVKITKTSKQHDTCQGNSWKKITVSAIGLFSNMMPNIIGPALIIYNQIGMDDPPTIWIFSSAAFCFFAANVFWMSYLLGQHCFDIWNFAQSTIFLVINLGYMTYFGYKASRAKFQNVVLFVICIVAVAAAIAIPLNVFKVNDVAGGFGITFTLIGHAVRLVSSGGKCSPGRITLTFFGVLGGLCMFLYKFSWTKELLFKIGTMISLISRGIDIFVMVYCHWIHPPTPDLARFHAPVHREDNVLDPATHLRQAPSEAMDRLAGGIQMTNVVPGTSMDRENTVEHSAPGSGNDQQRSTAAENNELDKDEQGRPVFALRTSTKCPPTEGMHIQSMSASDNAKLRSSAKRTELDEDETSLPTSTTSPPPQGPVSVTVVSTSTEPDAKTMRLPMPVVPTPHVAVPRPVSQESTDPQVTQGNLKVVPKNNSNQ